MANFLIGMLLAAAFVALTFLARARNGRNTIQTAVGAQAVALGLVCLLMVAGGFIFKSFVD
jgi:hypothetical protein